MIRLTDSIIGAGTSPKVFERGESLYEQDAIYNLAVQDNFLFGDCEGTEMPFYYIKIELDEHGIRSDDCSCPYNFGDYCKHTIAVLLAYARKPEKFIVRQSPQELLVLQTKEQLFDLITKLLQEKPELSEWFEKELWQLPSVARIEERKMEVDIDSYRLKIQQAIQKTSYGKYRKYGRDDDSLTDELDNVESSAIKFLESGDAAAACQIMLALFEENVNSFEYIDDSDGDHGDYLDRAAELFAETLLSLDLDAEREEFIDDIDRLYDHFSDYGVEGLEIALHVAEIGWKESDSYFESLNKIKLNVLDRKGKDPEFLALARSTGAHLRYVVKLVELEKVDDAFEYAMKNFSQPNDALKMAQLLREINHFDDSLQIAEKGLAFEGNKKGLAQWVAPIEETLGNNEKALQAWILVFREEPSLPLYQKLQKMPGANWKDLQPQLMTSMREGYFNKTALAEILLFEEDWDEALKLGNEKNNVYYGDVTQIVADGLIKHRPQWVIEISKKNFDELVRETKSKYYPKAVKWLQKAKLAYLEMDKKDEWSKYLVEIKETYKRRPSLQSELKSL